MSTPKEFPWVRRRRLPRKFHVYGAGHNLLATVQQQVLVYEDDYSQPKITVERVLAEEMHPDTARILARGLLEAADKADKWYGEMKDAKVE